MQDIVYRNSTARSIFCWTTSGSCRALSTPVDTRFFAQSDSITIGPTVLDFKKHSYEQLKCPIWGDQTDILLTRVSLLEPCTMRRWNAWWHSKTWTRILTNLSWNISQVYSAIYIFWYWKNAHIGLEYPKRDFISVRKMFCLWWTHIMANSMQVVRSPR